MSHRMGRKFDRHQILREKDPWEVAKNVFDVALEFALLGYVHAANDLFNLYESFGQGCKTSWSPGLYFAWEATGPWLNSIPPVDRTEEALAKMETERIIWKRQANATKEGLNKIIATANGEGKVDEWGEAQIRPDDLTAAIDLALFLAEKEKAQEILQTIADNFNVAWVDISKWRAVWQLQKDETLAKAIGVCEDKMAAFQEEVLGTFNERLQKGARREFRDLPMKDLVRMCNENTLKNAVWEEMELDPDNPPESIIHEGATYPLFDILVVSLP
ncbi:hypothetical protein BCR34DRAFT_608137 [Clohesyomyces aquaticus]|uniref:Uncharacterized protein n=1 Tax=Clohesyomyces aquaticus TaxID=1231657 RepID=A0A1Y1YA14_9PLEO|nr:hypothetical protein BCR34DRAFT_608137 [Clohesyomyces aquaticus]